MRILFVTGHKPAAQKSILKLVESMAGHEDLVLYVLTPVKVAIDNVLVIPCSDEDFYYPMFEMVRFMPTLFKGFPPLYLDAVVVGWPTMIPTLTVQLITTAVMTQGRVPVIGHVCELPELDAPVPDLSGTKVSLDVVSLADYRRYQKTFRPPSFCIRTEFALVGDDWLDQVSRWVSLAREESKVSKFALELMASAFTESFSGCSMSDVSAKLAVVSEKNFDLVSRLKWNWSKDVVRWKLLEYGLVDEWHEELTFAYG